MFDEYGIAYPDWSWGREEYLSAARRMTADLDGDGLLDQWGCSVDYWWQSYVYQNGGAVLSDDRGKCLLYQPAAYEGLQFMSDLVNKYHVSPNA